MKVHAEYEVKMPAYALSYLINADSSGLEDDDKKEIDFFMREFYDEANREGGSIVISPEEDEHGNIEPHFYWRPAFGLPCDVVDCNIIILVPEE
jgi:hypothetical protein